MLGVNSIQLNVFEIVVVADPLGIVATPARKRRLHVGKGGEVPLGVAQHRPQIQPRYEIAVQVDVLAKVRVNDAQFVERGDGSEPARVVGRDDEPWLGSVGLLAAIGSADAHREVARAEAPRDPGREDAVGSGEP